jgi:hypothetical protein
MCLRPHSDRKGTFIREKSRTESWAQPFPRTWMLRPSAYILRGSWGGRQPLAVRRQFTKRGRVAKWQPTPSSQQLHWCREHAHRLQLNGRKPVEWLARDMRPNWSPTCRKQRGYRRGNRAKRLKMAEQDKRGRHVRAVRACLHIGFYGTLFFWSVPSNT